MSANHGTTFNKLLLARLIISAKFSDDELKGKTEELVINDFKYGKIQFGLKINDESINNTTVMNIQNKAVMSCFFINIKTKIMTGIRKYKGFIKHNPKNIPAKIGLFFISK